MGLRQNPSQRQLRVGSELRKLRDAAGLTAAEAGSCAGLSGAHLGHMEAGRTAIPASKLSRLLHAYGVESDPYVQAVGDLNSASGRGWWSSFKDDVSRSALDLAELEQSATSHRVFDMVYLPGLLQTPEYMHALIDSANKGVDPDVRARYERFRLQRQEVLTGTKPPAYHAVIHEAALHMQFVAPGVMRRQLAHLVEVSRLPYVTIQILPFKSGGFPAVGTPFTFFGGAAPELSTIYLEHDAGAVFFDDLRHLDRYRAIFDKLTAVALAPLNPQGTGEFAAQRDSLSLLHHLSYVL